MSVHQDFANRLRTGKTVWAAGAFDALSAKMIEAAGFEALMTSGFGVSASHLGLPDAELYTMTENLNVIRNVVSAVEVPVIADADTGYGNAINVMRTVREFERAGVAALILEDQVSPKRCPICVAGVETVSITEGAAKIAAAKEARSNPDMLIIARTDAATPTEAMERARAYVAAGADIIQPISKCFSDIEGLRQMREAAGVPLSLQILGWLEKLDPKEVESVAGMATFALVPLMSAAAAMRENLAILARNHSSANLAQPVMSHENFIDLIGFRKIDELQLKYLENN